MRYSSKFHPGFVARAIACAAAVMSTEAAAADPRPSDTVGADRPLWSFATPVRPELPPVTAESWIRRPLDRFVLARLEAERLPPSPQADRTTLLRRLSLDLIGLPPTLDEVDAFVADDSADAIERQVDRLLASPHFGEQMAIRWLDLARYADTNGYDFDTPRRMHAWRDWVIDAFNRNVPFDRFALEQIAGDLLPAATLEQRIATGFLRNHATALLVEGQPGEYRDKYAVDRVNTIGTTFLGLTIGCAQCHDHKFDPLTQNDFYRLYAVINDFGDEGLRGRAPGNPVPFLHLPTETEAAELAELDAEIAALRARETSAQRDVSRELKAFITATRDAEPTPAATPTLRFTLDGDEPKVRLGGIGRVDWVPGVAATRPGRALHFDGKDGLAECGHDGEFHADQPFAIAALVRLDAAGGLGFRTVVARADVGSSRDRGYLLDIVNGRPRFSLVNDRDDAERIVAYASRPLETERWVHLCATYDGSRRRSGLALYVDGARVETSPPTPDEPSASCDRLDGEIDGAARLEIGLSDGAPFWGSIDEVQLHARSLTAEDVAALVRTEAEAIARLDSPDVESVLWLSDWFASRHSATMAPLIAQRRDVEDRKRRRLAKVNVISVAKRVPSPPETHLFVRGDYTNPGPVVTGAAPLALTAGVEVALADRLALARWIIAPENPLFARVAVNRLFAQFMGRGLVATSDDFGHRGAAPTHPELLDWLACEFRDSGYDVKALVRSFVTSATYLQSARCASTLRERDPENRLLARAERRRLYAENILDNAFAIGGLLDPTIGGKAQPIWRPQPAKAEEPALTASAAVESAAAIGPEPPFPARPRRGIYAGVVRAAPDPILLGFDAPRRDVCVASRTPTTTPLQSLLTWNDPAFVAASQGLATRMLAREGSDDERLAYGFRLCVARAPQADELAALREFLGHARDGFANRPEAARGLVEGLSASAATVAPADGAAFVGVAQVLLNLDATLTRE